ncbi:sugar phosphate isomerase/epimerase family protein [Actinopolymorpha alba]|uniref:sugar phosphate isomerase/epimerase family protein n=1 Tax=Actinopolymorpha alba TaxID=533267 RepID=UPI0003A452C3|nr:sugar phosphate isomerase/epimerase [Actinopolymorpha alba]
MDSGDAVPRWSVGCQARPWLQTLGDAGLTARLGEVMGEIGRIGYAGFETALRCLPVREPRAFAEMSEWAGGLVLTGAHAGARWWDPDDASAVDAHVAQASLLPALGCHRLVVSINALPARPSESQLDQLAASLTRLGRACREAAGVEVAVHNHAREIADGARVISAIVERCPAEDITLGADLGWVAYAGMDVPEFVERFGSRLAYLHLRDVTDHSTGPAFTEIGRGRLDMGAILRALRNVGYTGWIVVESEFSDTWQGAELPEETARAQLAGLGAFLDGSC